MSAGSLNESVVVDAALPWLVVLRYAVLHGLEIAVGEPAAERSDLNERDMALARNRAGHQRLRNAPFSYGGHV